MGDLTLTPDLFIDPLRQAQSSGIPVVAIDVPPPPGTKGTRSPACPRWDGQVYALASPEHWLKGYIAVRPLVQRVQQGKSLPQGWWNPGTLVVDQSNVDEIIARQQDAASRTRWFTPAADRQSANQRQCLKPLSAAT